MSDAARHLSAALAALDLGPDPELARTAERVAELWGDFRPVDPPALSTFEVPGAGPVVLRQIAFHSLCAHHMVPFFGHAELAYEPDGVVAGLGGLHATVTAFARRPQLQERMAEQIAAHLEHALRPRRLAVRLTARQMCLELRGGTFGTEVIAVATRGRDALDLLR